MNPRQFPGIINQVIMYPKNDQPLKNTSISKNSILVLLRRWIFCAEPGAKNPQKNLFLPLPLEGGRGDGSNTPNLTTIKTSPSQQGMFFPIIKYQNHKSQKASFQPLLSPQTMFFPNNTRQKYKSQKESSQPLLSPQAAFIPDITGQKNKPQKESSHPLNSPQVDFFAQAFSAKKSTKKIIPPLPLEGVRGDGNNLRTTNRLTSNSLSNCFKLKKNRGINA